MQMSDSKKKALRIMLDELKSVKAGIQEEKNIKKNKDALPKEDTGGMPSEVDYYKGLTYEQVISKALEGEKEAIFLGLYAIELAPDKDIKKLIEITNDENSHSVIYQDILDRLSK